MQKTQTYAEFKEDRYHFFEVSAKEAPSLPLHGFYVALGYLLAAPFSRAGRVIDAILDNDLGNMGGFFSFWFGIIPLIVGYNIATYPVFFLVIPKYIGHYLLDVPIGWLIPGFETSLSEDGVKTNSTVLSYLLAITIIPTSWLNSMTKPYFTHEDNPKMNGPFGFVLGVIPELALSSIVFICIIIEYPIALTGDYLRFNLPDPCRNIGAWFGLCMNTDEKQAEWDAKNEQAYNKGVGFNRQQFQAGKVNLFKELGTTFQEYQKNPQVVAKKYRKACVKCHPDKLGDNASDATNAQFEKLKQINQIFADEKHSAAYQTWFITNLATDDDKNAAVKITADTAQGPTATPSV